MFEKKLLFASSAFLSDCWSKSRTSNGIYFSWKVSLMLLIFVSFSSWLSSCIESSEARDEREPLDILDFDSWCILRSWLISDFTVSLFLSPGFYAELLLYVSTIFYRFFSMSVSSDWLSCWRLRCPGAAAACLFAFLGFKVFALSVLFGTWS